MMLGWFEQTQKSSYMSMLDVKKSLLMLSIQLFMR